MDTQSFARLRQESNLTQAAVAEALGLSPRTISSWETANPPRELLPIETTAVRDLLRPHLIDHRLRTFADQAYQTIPSELVAIWLVHGLHCILYPAASRLQDLEDLTGTESMKHLDTHQCVVNMVDKSLTTTPLRIGRPVNLAGRAIETDVSKKYRTRHSNLFRGGLCESLLHVPAFAPSARGPNPILLLSLENKLARDRSEFRVVKTATPPQIEVLRAGDARMLYTQEDVEVATKLADDFAADLLPKLQMLGLVE